MYDFKIVSQPIFNRLVNEVALGCWGGFSRNIVNLTDALEVVEPLQVVLMEQRFELELIKNESIAQNMVNVAMGIDQRLRL